MGNDWTKDELEQASKAMKANGQMGYEEFCEMLVDGKFEIECPEQNDAESREEVLS